MRLYWLRRTFIVSKGSARDYESADISAFKSFADREFYQDWWNSTSWDEFARKWNKPVHVRDHLIILFSILLAAHNRLLNTTDFPSSTRLRLDNDHFTAYPYICRLCHFPPLRPVSRARNGRGHEED